jgi:non-ribosomal peptide synthetase component F
MDSKAGRPDGAGDGRGTTLHALVREQARRTPAATAVWAPDGELDYAELVLRAKGLARRLAGVGLDAGPDTPSDTPIVGVCIERSLELPVALLGVLEAGAAYLPLDPAYPEQRLAHMLRDSGAAAVVCSAGTAERLRGTGVRCVLVGAGEDEEPADSAGSGAARDGGQDPALLPAYVIYTSGSTGEPKGVVVPHAALVNHARAMAAEYRLTSSDRVLQ